MPAINESPQKIENQQEIDLGEIASVPFATATISTSVGFPSMPADANKAVVCVTGGSVRWRPDGATTAPTASVGMILADGSTTVFLYGNTALSAVRFILSSGTPVVHVCYFG